jgi:hypothetical protein
MRGDLEKAGEFFFRQIQSNTNIKVCLTQLRWPWSGKSEKRVVIAKKEQRFQSRDAGKTKCSDIICMGPIDLLKPKHSCSA